MPPSTPQPAAPTPYASAEFRGFFGEEGQVLPTLRTEEDPGATFPLSPRRAGKGPPPSQPSGGGGGATTPRRALPSIGTPAKGGEGGEEGPTPHFKRPKRGGPAKRGLSRPEGPGSPPPRSPGKGRCPPPPPPPLPILPPRPAAGRRPAGPLTCRRPAPAAAGPGPSGLQAARPPRRPGDGSNRRRHLPFPSLPAAAAAAPAAAESAHCAGAGRPPSRARGGSEERTITWWAAP